MYARCGQSTRCELSNPKSLEDTYHLVRFVIRSATVLNANGENPKVIQELLRHATLKVTMDTYVQAMSDEKRKAQSKLSR